MDEEIISQLNRALEVEEELANILARAMEGLLLSPKTAVPDKKKKRILEIVNIIKNDTDQHKREVKSILWSLKRGYNFETYDWN